MSEESGYSTGIVQQQHPQHNDKEESVSSGIMTNGKDDGDHNHVEEQQDGKEEVPQDVFLEKQLPSLATTTENVTANVVLSSTTTTTTTTTAATNESDNVVVEENGNNVQDKEITNDKSPEDEIPSAPADTMEQVPSWLADDSTSHPGEEPLLSDIVWKQRSGFGKYAIQHSWERRRLLLEPTRIVYYHLDDSKPHGILDLDSVKVETTMGASFEITLSTNETKWRVCFDTRHQRETWLTTLQDMQSVYEKKANRATHSFQPGDHVIRWEMLPIAYPIQIHGIVLETGTNCVIVADFGLTTYKDDGTEKDDEQQQPNSTLSPVKESKWKKLLSFHKSLSQEVDKGEKVKEELENSPSKEQQEEATVDENEKVVGARILAKIKSKNDAFDRPAPGSSSKDQEEPDKERAGEEQASKADPLGTKVEDGPSQNQEEPAKQAGKTPGTSDKKVVDGTKQETEMRGVMGWGLSTKKKRLNVVVLTDPADIQKWHKVDYGRSLLDKTASFGSWFYKPSKDGEPVKGSTDDADHGIESRAEFAEENVRDGETEPGETCSDGSQGTNNAKKVGGIASWFQMPAKDDKYVRLNSQSLCPLSEKNEDGTETPNEENGFEKPQVEVVKEASLTEESAVNDENGTEKPQVEGVKEACLKKEFAAKDENRIENMKDEGANEPSLTEESAVKDENGTESHAELVDENVCLAESEGGTDSVAIQVTPELNTQDSSTATVPPNRTSPGTEEESSKQQKLPKSDPTEIVLARVNFLLEFGEDVLPPYHVFHSNSECIAVWCKTGRWSTLQAAVFLHSTAIGNAKSSMLLTASVAAAHVILVPALAVGGLAMVTAPWLILKQSKKHWDASTRKLTDLFWSRAEPAVFVAAIEHWSNLQ